MKAWPWIVGVLALAVAAGTRMRWPLDAVVITDPFGTPRPYGPHNGVDLRAPVGTPVHAPADGVVVDADENATSGRYLVLELSNGYRAGFAHLSDWVARLGGEVRRGDIIAYTGATGSTTAPHLHYTLKREGVWIDPETVHA